MPVTVNISIDADELLELISQEAFRLRYAWNNFKALFAGERENVDILNAAGPGVFGMLQRMLFDDAILQISRLTDPATNARQENTTLRRLILATGWDVNEPARYAEFMTKADAVDAACADCRKHRNKRISHRDLAWTTKALSLPEGTMRMVDSAINSIESFIRDFTLPCILA